MTNGGIHGDYDRPDRGDRCVLRTYLRGYEPGNWGNSGEFVAIDPRTFNDLGARGCGTGNHGLR